LNSRFVKTEAIVLNSVQFGEGHKIVNLFTEGRGKVEASAFGARKTKSRFGSKLEPFTILHLLLYHKNEESLFTIKEVEVRSHNISIRGDLTKYFIANSLIEPVIRFVAKYQSDIKLFNLLSDALRILDGIDTRKGVYLLSMYDIKLLSVLGYSPNTCLCTKCGRDLEGTAVYMDLYLGFPLCDSCKTGSSASVIDGTLKFINWVKDSSIKEAKKVTMKGHTLSNIRSVIEQLYLHTFHATPKSWKQLSEFVSYE
jgi:DNA repair protein RecO (recombination protein O)